MNFLKEVLSLNVFHLYTKNNSSKNLSLQKLKNFQNFIVYKYIRQIHFPGVLYLQKTSILKLNYISSF